MKIDVKSRWNPQETVYSADAPNLKTGLELAVKSGANLSGADLRKADLRGALLRQGYFVHADLRGASLGGANFSESHFGGADFEGADMSGVNMVDANFGGANFSKASMKGATMRGANLGNANFSAAIMAGAICTDSNMGGAIFKNADMTGANLNGSYLGGATFDGANMRAAHVTTSYLSGADFAGCEVGRAVGVNKHLITPLRILLDQPGKIRAYKLVTTAGESTDGQKHVCEVGKSLEVQSASVDESAHIGPGITLSTLDLCIRELLDDRKILVAEFEAGDIAAIPTGSNGLFRVHRCAFVGEKKPEDAGLPKRDSDFVS
jgi:hypothetical protein